MGTKLPLTHDDHIEIAQMLNDALALMSAIRLNCSTAYPKTHPINRMLRNWRANSRKMLALRSALDDEYHKVTNNDQFQKRGHVYYQWPSGDDGGGYG